MNSREDLDHLTEALDNCLAGDQRRFRRRISGLRKRLVRSLPVDKGLSALRKEIETSQQVLARRQAQQFDLSVGDELPIHRHVDKLRDAIVQHQVVIVAGETGSGKTTQIPKICLQAGLGRAGTIACTQPRRIAARSVARRLAEELSCTLGSAVGFQVRFQEQYGPETQVKFMTDGVLLAEASRDRYLSRYDTIIIDEAHERSLNIDFLLGYLKPLCQRRPELRIIVTSATIDTEKFSAHFHNAPVIEVEGRSFPVEIRYRPLESPEGDEPIEVGVGVAAAVAELTAAKALGDILVFASGERDIREISDHLDRQQYLRTQILPLFGRLSSAVQDQIFKPRAGGPRRIIVSTNVAETSLTVPGIRYVIDTGVARISRYSARSKIQRLPIEAISQASAQQRAGRCGRLGPGIAIRLYSEEDLLGRPAYTEPEILRTNLAAVILRLKSLGLGNADDFSFVDRPEPKLINDGLLLLSELGAIDARGQLTTVGKSLADLPVDVRLGRMLVEAGKRACPQDIVPIVAGLSIRDPRERPQAKQSQADEAHQVFQDPRSDFLTWLNLWRSWLEQRRSRSRNGLRRWCEDHFLSYRRMREWSDIVRQLQEVLGVSGQQQTAQEASYEQVHRALLSGLLGQIGMLDVKPQYRGPRGRRFNLFPGSALFRRPPKWVLSALILETTKVYARTNASIDVAWIEPAASHLTKHSYSDPYWSQKSGRVMAMEQVTLFGLPIVQQRRVHYGPRDPDHAHDLFILDGLVRDAVNSRGAFVQHNRKLRASIEYLENKRRQRDLLAEENVLETFFAQRVPAHIHTTKAFEKWRQQAEAQTPKLLYLTEQELLANPNHGISKQEFPDLWTLGGHDFVLKYAFSPGETTDGVTMEVPLHSLALLRSASLDWLVPGLLPGKIQALLRGLPKPLRRQLVPIPQTVDQLLSVLVPHRQRLTLALTELIESQFGLKVPTEAWPQDIPAHFMFNVRVRDTHGELLGEGRKLEKLQAQFSSLARTRFQQQIDQIYHEDHLSEWTFDALPEEVNLPGGGVAYPAVVDQETAVGLRLFEKPDVARSYHYDGILRLLRLQLSDKVKYLERKRAISDIAALRYRPIDTAQKLRADLFRASLQAQLRNELPRNTTQFLTLLEACRKSVVADCGRIGAVVETLLEHYHSVIRALEALRGRFAAAEDDIREQLGFLVYPGFLTEVAEPKLRDYPRYLKAVAFRLERLDLDPRRDEARMQIVRRYWKAYLAACEAADLDPLELDQLHWLIEEFRVSVFAQQLGTSGKISERTLNDQLKRLGRPKVRVAN